MTWADALFGRWVSAPGALDGRLVGRVADAMAIGDIAYLVLDGQGKRIHGFWRRSDILPSLPLGADA